MQSEILSDLLGILRSGDNVIGMHVSLDADLEGGSTATASKVRL